MNELNIYSKNNHSKLIFMCADDKKCKACSKYGENWIDDTDHTVGSSEVTFPAERLKGSATGLTGVLLSEMYGSKSATFGTYTRTATYAAGGIGLMLFSPTEFGKAAGITVAGSAIIPSLMKITGKQIAGAIAGLKERTKATIGKLTRKEKIQISNTNTKLFFPNINGALKAKKRVINI